LFSNFSLNICIYRRSVVSGGLIIKVLLYSYLILPSTCLLYSGAGANILRGVAGAGVLAGADKLKEVYVAARLS